jgi:molecular chaperone HscB
VCEACGELSEFTDPPTPFAAFGLEPAFPLDLSATQKRLLALARALHPDVHAQADAARRRRAERNTAELNAAFRVLSDAARRAAWLVRHLGGPGEDEERAMPQAFLQEVLEWNEAIEEARRADPGAAARRGLGPLRARLGAERQALLERLAATLTPLPAPQAPTLRAARRELNALRYLDRVLGEIEALDPSAIS